MLANGSGFQQRARSNKNNTRDRKLVSTSTTSSYGSMMDDEDDVKYARFVQQQTSHSHGTSNSEDEGAFGDDSIR